MPELPEVETCRRVMRRVLLGNTITNAEFTDDDIVFGDTAPEALRAAVVGRKVTQIGRLGKFWWIEFEDYPWLYGHLGMAGWIREYGAPTARLREHGKMPLDDETGRPRFLKMSLEVEDGRKIVLTDGRRLARVWLGEAPKEQKPLKKLGPDVFEDPRTPEQVQAILAKRSAPIKALLLDQTLFAGVGNWLADEALYQAGIAPKRPGSTLSVDEVGRMLERLHKVIEVAIEVGVDSDKYPVDWLFNTRWGGKNGKETHEGEEIVRETVGGRTTAWVPTRQK